MGQTGKVLMAINPLSPMNWLVFCSCYYLVYKKFLENNKMLKEVPYGASMTSCCSCISSCFLMYHMLCVFIPPDFPLIGELCMM